MIGVKKYLINMEREQKRIQLEHFNLLHRVLKVSNYNGRMFALNEIINLLQQGKDYEIFFFNLVGAHFKTYFRVHI